MRRKIVIAGLVALLVLGILGGTGFWSIHQAPAFYTEEIAKPVDPVKRHEQAKEFVQATLQLVDEIRNEEQWSEEFTQDQINAWLAEELPKKHPNWLPPGTRDPRLKLEKDAVELAFRCDDPRFKGVISGRFEPIVLGPNEFGVRIRRIRLGLVPLPVDQVLEQIGEPLRMAVAEAGMQMRWEQLDGDDVLVLVLKDDKRRPALESLTLKPGAIAISGHREQPRQQAAGSQSEVGVY